MPVKANFRAYIPYQKLSSFWQFSASILFMLFEFDFPVYIFAWIVKIWCEKTFIWFDFALCQWYGLKIIDILASMGESYEIRKYTSISELKNTLQNTPKSCDILILDIMLGENNGISFAECLRDTENQIPVIFISSSEKFVFDAYSAEPVGYILKPVSRQKLAEALTRAIRHLIPKSIIIDTPSRTVSFHIRDITYIEIINKELQIHLQDGTVTKIYKSLSAVREILPKDIFVQCHRCYIVSLYAVRSIRRFEITLNNHEIIPVSKYSYRDVQEQLQQYAAKWF